MKYKLIIAYILFLLVIVEIIHWIVFWNLNTGLAKKSHALFIENYKNTYPAFIRPLFPVSLTLLEMGAVLLSGILFITVKKRLYLILGIICFILFAWLAFTLM